MHQMLDFLILMFGVVGFLCLLGGCLVVAGYLLCTGLPRRPLHKEHRADLPTRINLFPW